MLYEIALKTNAKHYTVKQFAGVTGFNLGTHSSQNEKIKQNLAHWLSFNLKYKVGYPLRYFHKQRQRLIHLLNESFFEGIPSKVRIGLHIHFF